MSSWFWCPRQRYPSTRVWFDTRPAAKFVKTANRFSCHILVERESKKINGHSILGLMKLALNIASDEDKNGTLFQAQTEVLPDPFSRSSPLQ